MIISILCPTRGRPTNLHRLVKSAIDMATRKDQLEFVFYVDDDDLLGQAGLKEIEETYSYAIIKKCIGPRIILTETWNVCYRNSSGEIFMHCGDDIEFKTSNWDEIVRHSFIKSEDKILFAHGTDGANHDRFGTHGFVHNNWIKTVGYFLPPYFSSDYADTWLNDVSNKIGRRKYIPIYTMHHHPIFGLAEWDQTHQERLARHNRDNVAEIYASKTIERDIDALKLKNFILEFQINKLIKFNEEKYA